MIDLEPIRICEKCESVMRLHCQHPIMQWYEYLCPKCDESVYNKLFPTEKMQVEYISKKLFDYINKDLKKYNKDDNLNKEILLDLIEKLNNQINT